MSDKVDAWMPLHIGRYMAATGHLSNEEHGMYLLLLMHAWANGGEIPGDPERVRRICRADPKDWARSSAVILDFLTLQPDGTYRQKRLDLELAKAADLKGAKSEAGKKGAESRWQKHGTANGKGDGKEIAEPIANDMANGCPIPVPKPTPKTPPEKRFPDGDSTTATASTLGAAALAGLRHHEPLTLGEAKIPGGEDTPAAYLAAVLKANGLRGNAFHPAIIEWARDGITVERLKDAIAKARQRPGKERGVFGPEYLSPILYDETKPAAQVHQERAAQQAGKAVDKTQAIIAEQRAREKSPMPEHLRPKPKEAAA